MSATNNEELSLLDARLGSGSPTTWFVGLSTTTPNEDGTGITEPVGNGYARVSVTNNATNFPAATNSAGVGTKSNGTVVTFPVATANWSSGANMTHWVLFTASTAGEARYRGALDTPKPVLSGDTASFAVGALRVTMD